MATSFTFSSDKLLDTAKFHRANAWVEIINGGNASSKIDCLVDTGSDWTILPLLVAQSVGINPPFSSTANFITASGSGYSLPVERNVTIRIEGYRPNCNIVLSSAAGFVPILGRLELMWAFNSGLDTVKWYWG